MLAAGLNQPPQASVRHRQTKEKREWGAFLRLSPLAPPQKGSISVAFSGAAARLQSLGLPPLRALLAECGE